MTGAGRRLGNALALELAAQGYRLVLHANRSRARAEATARGSVAWVWPVGGAAVLFVLAAGATVTAVRMGSAWALKVRRQADIPLMINYDPHTLTAPIMLALVAGVPTLVNPNTGDVLPLNAAHNAEAARLRYMAAQNIVALQAGGEHAPMIPALDEVQ